MAPIFTPYPTVPALRSQLLTNPPTAVPPIDDLLSLEEELKNLKNKSLARLKKAEADVKVLDGFHRKYKDKDKDKGKLKDKVKVKREPTGEPPYLCCSVARKPTSFDHRLNSNARSSCTVGTFFNSIFSPSWWLWRQGFSWFEECSIKKCSDKVAAWNKEVLSSGIGFWIFHHQGQIEERKRSSDFDRERQEEVCFLLISFNTCLTGL